MSPSNKRTLCRSSDVSVSESDSVFVCILQCVETVADLGTKRGHTGQRMSHSSVRTRVGYSKIEYVRRLAYVSFFQKIEYAYDTFRTLNSIHPADLSET